MLYQSFNLFAAASLLLAAVSASHADEIRLHRTVEVRDDILLLGDIAQFETDSDALLARLQQVRVAPAPAPGTSRMVDVAEVRECLTAHQVPVDTIAFRGSRTVLVRRRHEPADPQRHRVLHSASVTPLAPASADNGTETEPDTNTGSRLTDTALRASDTTIRQATLTTSQMRMAEDVVEHVVRDYLSIVAPHWGQPRIHPIPNALQAADILAMNPADMHIASGQPHGHDHFLITLAGSTNTGAATSITIKTRIVRRPRILVARRDLPQKAIVQASDLEWKEVDDAAGGSDRIEDFVNMEIRRSIRSGQPVLADHVTPQTLIKRNDLVTVTAGNNLVKVTTRMKALGDGLAGQSVSLETLDGRDVVIARVVARGEATLIDAASPAASVEMHDIESHTVVSAP